MLTREQNVVLNIEEMAAGKIVLESLPRIASIGLTLRCNLNCIMCFTQNMKKFDMASEVLENVSQLFPTLEEVRWNDAGELFAAKDCRKYLNIINDVKIPKSYVSSNFKAVGKYMDDILGGGLTHLSVSIDASTADTYHRIRRGGNFDGLLRNLEIFHTLKQQRGLKYPLLTLVFIAMKSNIHELPDFVDMAHRFDAVEIHVLKLLPNPAGTDKTETILLEDLQPYYREAYARAVKYKIRLSHIAYTDEELLSKSTTSKQPIIDSALIGRQSHFLFKGKPFCASPWTEMLIDVTGKVRPCCYHPKVLGDLNKDSVLDIWNNEEYQEFRRKILNQDFTECHHCSWQHKVFHYLVPEQKGIAQPINWRLKTMERAWDLKQDIVKRLHPFGDIKIELDPLANRMNKEWDCDTVLPPLEIAENLTSQKSDQIKNLQKTTSIWTNLAFDKEITSENRTFRWLIVPLKKAILRILKFHTGVRFELQRETNLNQLRQIEQLWQNEDEIVSYLSLMKHYLDNQKNFNALLVQYINQFSDKLFDRIDRQKDMNMEILHSFRQTNERIDQLTNDNVLILELINKLDSTIHKKNEKTIPNQLSEIFFSGKLFIGDFSKTLPANNTKLLNITIENTSLRTWNIDSAHRVGVDYKWLDKQGKEKYINTLKPIWFDKKIAPKTKLKHKLTISTPTVPGKYNFLISLVTADGRWFSTFKTGSLTFNIEITNE